MRHGEAFRPGMDPQTQAPGSSLTLTGLGDATAVGRRLAESLGDLGLVASDVTVVCAPSPEARDTAAALAGQLNPARSAVELTALDLTDWTPHSEDDAGTHWTNIDAEMARLELDTSAVVLVAHDPQASWLLHHLIDEQAAGQRRASPLPLARGELAMLGRGPEPYGHSVLWVLSPSDNRLVDELHAKIKSKMDSAKLLGAFLTALLVFAARELSAVERSPAWYPWVAGLALVLLALATAAYFVTMFLYDELLMPVRFWPSRRPSERPLPRGFVARPPSSAGWVLYQNMMHVWSNAFIPATLLAGGGAIAVTVALARPHGLWWLAVGLSIGAVVGVTAVLLRIAKPALGVSD